MAILGLIDGLGDAIVSVSQAVSGYYSDKLRKRKVFVWLGYMFGGISRIGYAFASVWQWLVPLRVFDRAGKMRGAPRDAMIADSSGAASRGENFGILRTADNAGAFLGVIFAIGALPLIGFNKLFLLAAVPSLIGTIFIVYLIKEKNQGETKIYKGLDFRNLDNNFRWFLLLSAIFSLGSFSYSFLMVFAEKYGFQATTVPMLYLIFTAAATLTSLPFGRLSDKIKSRKKVLLLSYILWGLVCAVLVIDQSVPGLILSFVLYGAHKGALEAVQKAFVSELAPKEYRASSLGTFQLVIGLFALPASLMAGILWNTFNPMVPFGVSLILTAISAAMMIFVKEKSSPD